MTDQQTPPDIVAIIRERERNGIAVATEVEAADEIERLRRIEAAAKQLLAANGFGDENWKALQEALKKAS